MHCYCSEAIDNLTFQHRMSHRNCIGNVRTTSAFPAAFIVPWLIVAPMCCSHGVRRLARMPSEVKMVRGCTVMQSEFIHSIDKPNEIISCSAFSISSRAPVIRFFSTARVKFPVKKTRTGRNSQRVITVISVDDAMWCDVISSTAPVDSASSAVNRWRDSIQRLAQSQYGHTVEIVPASAVVDRHIWKHRWIGDWYDVHQTQRHRRRFVYIDGGRVSHLRWRNELLNLRKSSQPSHSSEALNRSGLRRWCKFFGEN